MGNRWSHVFSLEVLQIWPQSGHLVYKKSSISYYTCTMLRIIKAVLKCQKDRRKCLQNSAGRNKRFAGLAETC